MALGALVGLAAYGLVLPLHSPWEEAVAAALLGGVSPSLDGSLRRVWLGVGSCLAGWLAGTVVFGLWLDIGIGAWIVAGAFLGAAAGAFDGLSWRVVPGLVLGTVAGALAEASRFLPVFFEPLRGVDMQQLLLVGAGLLLACATACVAPRGSPR
jgi:hypothetical protein